MRRICLAFALFLLPDLAWAACSSTITVKDGSGTNQTFCVGTDGSGNFFSKQIIVDATAGVNGLAINGSGQLSISNSSFAATQSGSWAFQPIAGTTSGATNYYVQPAASDNHANIKNGAGTVYGVQTTNNSATTNYIRLYNAGSGFNGCGSATNLIWGMEIPAPATASGIGGGFTISFPVGMTFSTGVSICVTSGYGSTDTTNATASAMMVNVQYD